MTSQHAGQPPPLHRDGMMQASLELVLTSASFARIRFAIVIRRTQNRPLPALAQMCVKPRKSNVSGLPRPRAAGRWRHAARTRSAASCPGAAPTRTSRTARVARPGTAAHPPRAETHDEVVRETHDDHITVRVVTPPPVGPQVEHVMQVHVRQQRRHRCPLRRTLLTLRPLPVLDDPCGQPLADQPQDPFVRDPVLEKLPQPA